MKRLYLETNFIVGQAFSQDLPADSILPIATALGAELCIPSVCAQEALSTVEWRNRSSDKFSGTLKSKLNELRADQSATARRLVILLNQALLENGRLVNERQIRLAAIFQSLLKVRFAHVDPILTHRAVSAPILEGAADNLILYAVTFDAATKPLRDMAFFTLNVSDFGATAVVSALAAVNVTLLTDSNDVIIWLNTP